MRANIKPHRKPIIDVDIIGNETKRVLTFIYCNWDGQICTYGLTRITYKGRAIPKSEIVINIQYFAKKRAKEREKENKILSFLQA